MSLYSWNELNISLILITSVLWLSCKMRTNYKIIFFSQMNNKWKVIERVSTWMTRELNQNETKSLLNKWTIRERLIDKIC